MENPLSPRKEGLLPSLIQLLALSCLWGCSFLLLPGCSQPSAPPGSARTSPGQKEGIENLQGLLRKSCREAPEEFENRFILWEQIIRRHQEDQNHQELQARLGRYIQAYPDDPFNTYYLYVLARNYKNRGRIRPAVQYLEILLKNHPDLKYQEESIHYLALKNLIQLLEDPYERLTCYKEIYSRFSAKLQIGRYRYYLAQTYEDLGEWEKAIDQYRLFLKHPDTIIPGNPNARKEIQNRVTFYDSDKSWAREDLSSLIGSIRYAVRTMNVPLLRRYQSQVDFFLLSWNHTEQASALGSSSFNIRSFLKQGIRFAPSLDTDSNENEAYLRSTGWYFNTPWYFYFRKVDFPADPEINGRWEWAGIYFGEKM